VSFRCFVDNSDVPKEQLVDESRLQTKAKRNLAIIHLKVKTFICYQTVDKSPGPSTTFTLVTTEISQAEKISVAQSNPKNKSTVSLDPSY
jgi:hypothetical protein